MSDTLIYAFDQKTFKKKGGPYKSIGEVVKALGANKGAVSRSMKHGYAANGLVFMKMKRPLRDGDFRIIESTAQSFKPKTLQEEIYDSLPKF